MKLIKFFPYRTGRISMCDVVRNVCSNEWDIIDKWLRDNGIKDGADNHTAFVVENDDGKIESYMMSDFSIFVASGNVVKSGEW